MLHGEQILSETNEPTTDACEHLMTVNAFILFLICSHLRVFSGCDLLLVTLQLTPSSKEHCSELTTVVTLPGSSSYYVKGSSADPGPTYWSGKMGRVAPYWLGHSLDEYIC